MFTLDLNHNTSKKSNVILATTVNAICDVARNKKYVVEVTIAANLNNHEIDKFTDALLQLLHWCLELSNYYEGNVEIIIANCERVNLNVFKSIHHTRF